MTIFTIETETNNITLHNSIREAENVANAERFRNQAGLAKLAADWPAARLVEIWNGLPGQAPVRKFKDRATAVSRIWKAIQSLDGLEAATVKQPEGGAAADERISLIKEDYGATHVATQTPDVAPKPVTTKDRATRAKKTGAATKASAARDGSKTGMVIAMLKREGGATLEEIMTEMGWQSHTTRALMSAGGSLTRNHGLAVISEKIGDKRVYSIKS